MTDIESGNHPRISHIRHSRRAPAKPVKSQIPYAIILLIAIIAFGTYLSSPKLAFAWAIAVALGLTLQRARFCFTAAMRDPVLTGSTSLTKAVVISLAICTVGFAALHLGAYFKHDSMADAIKVASVEPVGLNTAIGAFLFGIGAVLAGGCASGTLMRVGEGMMQNVIALITFVAGSGVAAATWPLWRDFLAVNVHNKVYLPDVLGGFLPALLLQFALLFIVWCLADMWGKRKA